MNKRIISIALCVFIMLCAAPAARAASPIRLEDFGGGGLNIYLSCAKDLTMLRALVAVDLAEGRSIESPNSAIVQGVANAMANAPEEKLSSYISYYTASETLAKSIKAQAARLDGVLDVLKNKAFPLPAGVKIWYADNWHAYRGEQGERLHEGIDISCPMGTPVRSMGEGVVEKLGWNTLGGWRVGVRDIDGRYYYYAHLSGFADGLKVGTKVQMGQVIGYSGDSGNGPSGTTGLYEPHLHIGIYESGMRAVNPYAVLIQAERNRW